jgi:hypothetical protein
MSQKIIRKFELHLFNALQSKTSILFGETCVSSSRVLARIIHGYETKCPNTRIIFSDDKLNLFLKAIKIAGNANRKILGSRDKYYLYHLQLGKLLPSQNKMPSFQHKLDAFKKLDVKNKENEDDALKILKEMGVVDLKYSPQAPDFL